MVIFLALPVNNVGKFQNNGPDYFLQVSAKVGRRGSRERGG